MSDRRPPPKTGAERQAEYDRRLRAGALWVAGDVPGRLVEGLIDDGLLLEGEAEDQRAIMRALVEATARWVRYSKARRPTGNR